MKRFSFLLLCFLLSEMLFAQGEADDSNFSRQIPDSIIQKYNNKTSEAELFGIKLVSAIYQKCGKGNPKNTAYRNGNTIIGNAALFEICGVTKMIYAIEIVNDTTISLLNIGNGNMRCNCVYCTDFVIEFKPTINPLNITTILINDAKLAIKISN